MNNLILIPARSGSTRVKNKNIKNLGDKPLIGHIITSAVRSQAGRVVVSTNSPQIADIAEDYGAETPFMRPEDLSTHVASSLSVILHALEWFKNNENWTPDIIAFCPPTNPFTKSETIRNMVGILRNAPRFNSIVTITEPDTHPFKIVHLRADGKIENGVITIDGKNINDIERSQDWPRVWEGSPACRMSRSRYFLNLYAEKGNKKTYDIKNCLGYKIDRYEAFDIDIEEDFMLAEKIMRY